MREIKFRAWWPHVKKMRYFGEPIIILDSKERCGMFLPVDPAEGTVFFGESIPMQFTGLRDKSGREIYEGDICRCYTRSGEPMYDQVCYKKGCFIWGDDPDDLLRDWCGDLEVVGNIYENPELLSERR